MSNKSLGDREFEIVLAAFQEMTFAEGHDIIRQGAEGDLFYVVSSGTCDIFVNGSLVSQVGPGQSFGELALLYDAPRAATVRASSPCTCWALDRVRKKISY